ncbi:MAG TPA: hypothetical protein VMB18_14690 [Terriglobales bacterium]|nr:hypothetical protein [Terriglobales bacterium]
MPETKTDSTTPTQQPSKDPYYDESALRERQEKEADEMARAAQKVERRYDQEHDIFTK